MNNVEAKIQILTEHNWLTIATTKYDCYNFTLKALRQSPALKDRAMRVIFDYSSEYKAVSAVISVIANETVQSEEAMNYILENFPITDNSSSLNTDELYCDLEAEHELLNPQLSKEIEDAVIEV